MARKRNSKPAATSAASEAIEAREESSPDEIPSRAELKRREAAAAKQLQEETKKAAEEEEEEEDGEDEYVVEKIVEHRFRGKKNPLLEFLVKWEGYDDKENTWEPEENVLDTTPLDKYYEEIGGKPEQDKPKTPAPSDSKKRKLSQAATETPTASWRFQYKRIKQEDDGSSTPAEPVSNGRGQKNKKADPPPYSPYPEGSWENHIVAIETMERSIDDGKLRSTVHWKDGRAPSRIQNDVLNKRCPQTLLQFYEAHLQFNAPRPSPRPSPRPPTHEASEEKDVVATSEPADALAQFTNGTTKAAEADGDEDFEDANEDIDEEGVKGVATAT